MQEEVIPHTALLCYFRLFVKECDGSKEEGLKIEATSFISTCSEQSEGNNSYYS